MLQNLGLLSEKVPEAVNLTHPNEIIGIHRAYIQSGADIIYTNTCNVNRYKLSESIFSVEQLIGAGVFNARKAVETENKGTLVALSCGPIGQMLRPNGDLSFENAYDIFREIVISGEKAGSDLVVFETFTDLLEMKAAVLAAKENSALPIFCTMTFEENGRTFAGSTIASAAVTLEALGVTAVGINCSLGPKQILPLAVEMRKWTSLPMIVKANAGLPNLSTNKYDVLPDDFASVTDEYLKIGVNILGGCCGTTPDYIKKMKKELLKGSYVRAIFEEKTVLCSAERTVVVDGVKIIGERINPTGKKLFKEALKNHSIGYILEQALEQTTAGAEILDVNVGLPEIDEVSMMSEIVEAIQGITGVPLQIDSSNPQAIEAALRIYNGKPLVNSVNGEEKVLRTILPIVKKYGAAVIGLTLDENGIPPLAEDRVKIAKKIIETAKEYGIQRSDVIIDCLTLTASVQQKEAYETLKAVKLVKETLHVKTALGVSNISFGLPERELINTAFLTLAMAHGLDLPIINPNVKAMTGAVDAFNVLYHRDIGSVNYIKRHSQTEVDKLATVKTIMSLSEAVESGIKQTAYETAKQLLETTPPSEIIDRILIPALDRVGEKFEKGILFLPQLIQSATAAEACFDLIKQKLSKEKGDTVSKGKIVLATVKGDIHDIGKNIVKVILENYGYEIIDLGKDVPIEKVVAAAVAQNVKLVGLSALMTTTVKNMEETIRALRENIECKIMVGGAVLTPDYAKTIGADFYARDAKAAVDIAKIVFK